MGDDINDLTVFNSVNAFIVPANAHEACKEKASLIANSRGGFGFIKIVDQILFSKGINPYMPFKTKNDF